MELSNEPGYYKRGKYGIRIENLLYVKKLKGKLFFENGTDLWLSFLEPKMNRSEMSRKTA